MFALFRRDFIVVCFLFGVLAGNKAFAELSATGYAKYAELSDDVFVVALFTDSGRMENIADVKRLDFKVISKKLGARRLVRLFSNNAAINNSAEMMTRNAEGFERFTSFIQSNLYQGDHLSFVSNSDNVAMFLNEVELGSVQSRELFTIFLNIYIGDVPPSREFKDALIGSTDSADAEELFNSLKYNQKRKEDVVSWLTKGVAAAADTVVEVVDTEEERKAKEDELARKRAAAVKAEKIRKQKLAEKKKQEEIARQEELARLEVLKAEENLLRERYMADLTRLARKNIEYPRRAQKFKQTGNVVALVTIGRDGTLVGFEYENQSEYGLLNKAVKKGVESALPFPKMPDGIRGDSLTFRVPVSFSLGG